MLGSRGAEGRTWLAVSSASNINSTSSGSSTAMRLNTKKYGLTAISSAAAAAHRARFQRDSGSTVGSRRRSSSTPHVTMPINTTTVSARAATMPTPVNRNSSASSIGHTGSAAAGLKSPGRCQVPRR